MLYSSKAYPPIHNHDNKECPMLQIQIRSQRMQLTSKDFFQLTQLIFVDSIPEIKNTSLQVLVTNSNNLVIAHIFIYYCIKINMKLEIEGLESVYLKELAKLYVSSQFHIEVIKFAKLCEIVTGIAVRKCAHIIYYLVYGRLATNSYIETILNQWTPHSKKDKQKMGQHSNTPKKDNIKEKEKEKDNSNNTVEENFYEDLVEDLKKIFHRPPPAIKRTFYFQKSTEHTENATNDGEVTEMDESQRKYYMSFFPNRVFNDEKSAIFEEMHPNCRSNYKFMRKKRFNDQKIEKLLYSTLNASKAKACIGESEKDAVKSIREKNKIFPSGSMKTNQKYKTVSQELDKIRSVITKERKRGQNSHKGININEKEREYLEMKERVERKQPEKRTLLSEMNKCEYNINNNFVSLVRKEKNNAKGNNEDDDEFNAKNRENQTMIFGNLENQEERGNVNRIFHADCQYRLFQYKNQFRKFMKVHFFPVNGQ